MAMLDARGMFPVRIAASKSAATVSSRWSFGRRIRSRYMAAFYSQLADLLHSGVPMLGSLDILERQSSQPALSQVLREVRAKVADGTSLADAMARHPKAFNELAVSMVRAGQEGGFREDVLKRSADLTEHHEDLKAKVVGALAYPLFLAVTGLIVLNVLIVFFVPRFEPIFKRLEEKGDLPTLTQVLMSVSKMMQTQGWLLVILVVVGIVFFRRWAATPNGRLRLDGWRLRLPGAGH